jgi:allantoicase
MRSEVVIIEKPSPDFVKNMDLAQERLGGSVLSCSDDFFASVHNLIKPGRGIFIDDKFTERGKWMDGWESRRKRTPGNDWAILKLGAPGRIIGVDIDTNHFLGNHPPHAALEACCLDEDVSVEALENNEVQWVEILPKSPLEQGNHNFYEIESNDIWTHLRIQIYPDGGVARLKVYGEVFKNWSKVTETETLDLASALNGGKSILCNDMFFSHMDNLIMPGRGINMGDGWETKRNRTPNNRDWVIVRLGHKGKVEEVLVDTCHFKGNYPDTCSLEGCLSDTSKFNPDKANWQEILSKVKLEADHEHNYKDEIQAKGPFTHIRLNIFPDGGVSRLRVFGTKKES